MEDNYNLVDSTLQDMRQNNPSDVLNYHPSGMMMGSDSDMDMGGGQHMMARSPIPTQRQVRMGEVDYIPAQQQQAPTMQNHMVQNMNEEEMYRGDDDDADAVMEAPDLTNYGMEDEDGMFNNILGELRLPLVVAVLAFLLAMPQVNGFFRNLLSRFVTNPLYVNGIMALALGIAVWLVTKFF